MRFVLVALSSFLFSLSYGQLFHSREKDKLFNPEKHPASLITLSSNGLDSVVIDGLGHIQVEDARADSFALGYMKKGLFINYKKIQFAEPGLKEVERLANMLLSKKASGMQYDMLIVVKELWLSEEETDMDDRDKMRDLDERLFPTSTIKVYLEFYCREGERYYPLCRLDTSLFKTLPLRNYASEYIGSALAMGLKKAAAYDLRRVSTTKKAVTLADIHDYNNRRFRHPVLHDSSFRKGVYMNFSEFKNNAPSVEEFEVQRGSLGDVLYMKTSTGSLVASRSVWGYCDGRDLFIKAGENYYKLFRIGNSFYFNGSKEISRAEVNSYNERGKRTVYRNILSPLKLNTETGTVY